MFNLEGIIPKLCQLAQDVGDGERVLRLRSAGLQALASMVENLPYPPILSYFRFMFSLEELFFVIFSIIIMFFAKLLSIEKQSRQPI